MFNVRFIVCGSSVFVFVLVGISLCSSSFAIILKRKRKLDALHLLSYICNVTINVLWLFLAVLWVALQCVNVVFPDHSYLHFAIRAYISEILSST